MQNTVDVDTLTNQHSTALHIAAWKGYCHVIECLVGWGAALDIGDQMGNTPLLLIVLGKLPMFTDSPRLNKVRQLFPCQQAPLSAHVVNAVGATFMVNRRQSLLAPGIGIEFTAANNL